MTDSSFAAMTTLSCSRKRRAMAGTLTTLAGLVCTPLAPVDTETRQTLGLNAPHVVWEVHFQGAPDIKKGDIFTANSVDYQVMDASPWHWLPTTDTRTRVIIEDLLNNAV